MEIWILAVMFILGGIFAVFGGFALLGAHIAKPNKDLVRRVACLEGQTEELNRLNKLKSYSLPARTGRLFGYRAV